MPPRWIPQGLTFLAVRRAFGWREQLTDALTGIQPTMEVRRSWELEDGMRFALGAGAIVFGVEFPFVSAMLLATRDLRLWGVRASMTAALGVPIEVFLDTVELGSAYDPILNNAATVGADFGTFDRRGRGGFIFIGSNPAQQGITYPPPVGTLQTRSVNVTTRLNLTSTASGSLGDWGFWPVPMCVPEGGRVIAQGQFSPAPGTCQIRSEWAFTMEPDR
jgi:hypothetical protein